MAISSVFGLYSYTLGVELITKTFPNFPSWALVVCTILSILQLVAVALLWMWKKIGFYIIIVMAIFTASLNGMLLGSVGVGGTIMVIIGVIGVGILYLAMKSVWNNFK